MELVFPPLTLSRPGRFAEPEQVQESLTGRITLPSEPLAVVGRNNTAAVLLRDGRVALLCLNDRTLLWTETSHVRSGELPGRPGQNDLNMLHNEHGIYILTRDGATGLTHDGRRIWSARLRGAVSLPAFGDDGILYSGGNNWVLYAHRMEDRIRSVQRLIYTDFLEGYYGTRTPPPSSWAEYHFRFDDATLGERFAEIEAAIRNGNVGAMEKEYLAWLMETAGSYIGSPRPLTQGPAHVQHRAEAARLLAYIGSRETIPFLADLFTRDPSPHIRSIAAETIGRIGVDPEGLALFAFQTAILPPFRLLNESVLTAVAGATGALCRFSGPPLSDIGVRLLTILASYDWLPAVRNRAQMELRSLFN